MRCEVGAFVVSKRRKTRAMRRGKERGAAPKKCPVVLVRRGGELEKRGTMSKKQPCFAKKCSTFAQKFPCFQRVPPILRRAVLDFAPEVEHLSSDERVLSFGGFVRWGVHVPYFAACCTTIGRLPLPRNRPLPPPSGGVCPKKSGRLVARSAGKVELLYRLPSRRIVKGRALARNSPKSRVE